MRVGPSDRVGAFKRTDSRKLVPSTLSATWGDGENQRSEVIKLPDSHLLAP